MAIMIGTVKLMSGAATATDPEGKSRNLNTDSVVYAEDLITTDVDGTLVVEFINGSTIDLGSNAQLTVDESVFDPSIVTESPPIATDVDDIQQAILEGADPTEIADDTAAGAGVQAGGNEGHSPVYVDYLAPEVIPESGFDTTGISIAFPKIEEELQAPVVDEPSEPEEVPIVSISTGIEGGSAIEGDDVIFTVNQNNISDADTTLTIEILSLPSDSAIEGADYEVIDTITVVIPAGSTFSTFNVATYTDTLKEGNEAFTARIISTTNPNSTVNVSTGVSSGIILDQYSSPLGGDTVHLTADEALIVDTVINNSLTFTAGTTDITSFEFDTDLSSLKIDTNDDGVNDVSWNRVSDTQIEGLIGSSVAITLTLTASTIMAGTSADVTVQAVLDDAFQHLAIPGRNPLDLGNIKVIASTGVAGDEVTGTAFLAVIDDVIEITSITNTSLTNAVGAEATGDLVIDTGADGLASLTFTGTVPLGLTTADGHEISYQPQTDGSLKAVDINNDSVFSLTHNDTGDGYTIALDQLLQGPIVETTVALTGASVNAGAPIEDVTQVSQNGVIVNISATDSSGPDLINASSDGYGVDNGLVEEGDSEVVSISLEDPAGSFSNMSVTVGNFSTTGGSNDIYSYQLYLDGDPVGDVQNVTASASNESTNTTISINGSGFDEIQMWASHSGGNTNSEGSYKIISVDSDVTATSYEDVILNFGVDAVDTDGDYHGGDFQVAIDINHDFSYLPLDDPSLDTLINDNVDEIV